MLRDYQERGIDELRRTIRTGHRKPIMVLPTGGGKSIIFGRVIANALEKDKTVLWLVHRRNLVYQMEKTLIDHFDIHPGLIMAGCDTYLSNPVQLCTIQTYQRRLNLDDKGHNNFFVNADLVLIDEGHRSLSPTYRNIIDLYQDKIVIACTATPMRADGRGMGEIYDSIVDIANITELTEKEYLSPVRYFVPVKVNLKGVSVQMGDYVVKDLDKKINKPKLIGDVVENWLKNAEGRPTIVFCVNVKHSIAVKEAFIKAGVKAEHLDARSNDEERDEAFKAMERGDITVLCNVALYQEGLDVPSVSCIVMARPTKSMGLWRQCAGRGLRVEKGKENLIIFDHGNVIEENGFLEDSVEWSLDGKKRAWKISRNKKVKQPVKCRVCNLVFEGGNICPDCGSAVKKFGKKVETAEGELKEVKGKKTYSTAEKRMWYGMFLSEQKRLDKSKKWLLAQYKSKFDVWPRNMDNVLPIEANKEVKNWLTYQRIKWIKSKKAA